MSTGFRQFQHALGCLFQSLVRVVLNEHSLAAVSPFVTPVFQSLVRVVLNEHKFIPAESGHAIDSFNPSFGLC